MSFDSSVNSERIFVRIIEPADKANVKAVLQIAHGMAEHSLLYVDFAKHIASNGYAVAINDHLGHGKSVSEGGAYGYFGKGGCQNMVKDMHKLYTLMLCIGPVSSVFDIATFILLWNVFGCNTASNPALVALFNAGWFVESLISQTLIIHLIRTPKIPFIQSRAAAPVVLLTTIIMIIGIIIPFTPLGAYLGMTGLPLVYFAWLALIILSYILLAQIVKTIYIKATKSWL